MSRKQLLTFENKAHILRSQQSVEMSEVWNGLKLDKEIPAVTCNYCVFSLFGGRSKSYFQHDQTQLRFKCNSNNYYLFYVRETHIVQTSDHIICSALYWKVSCRITPSVSPRQVLTCKKQCKKSTCVIFAELGKKVGSQIILTSRKLSPHAVAVPLWLDWTDGGVKSESNLTDPFTLVGVHAAECALR